jgi:hypothetical protein
MKNKAAITLILILVLATAFRLTGINWDQNQHLHPDERFMVIVSNAVSFPQNLASYFDTKQSPLNPHNVGFPFYVYGDFPLSLVKIASVFLKMDTYNGTLFVGRVISAIFDILTVFLVYLITLRLIPNKSAALLSSLLYSVSVLPIQLSHFFAVDTFLVFFLAFALYVLLLFYDHQSYLTSSLLGICLGLAVSCKISAVIFIPVIGLGFLIIFFRDKRKRLPLFLQGLVLISFFYLSLRLFYPYLFASPNIFSIQLNPSLIGNFQELQAWSKPNLYFPPAVMWLNYPRYLYSFSNAVLWGWGIPLGVLSLFSFCASAIMFRKNPKVILVIFSVLVIWIYQMTQLAQPMRYFYPAYPFIAVLSGIVSFRIITKIKNKLLPVVFLSLIFIWPLAFLSIYQRPHSRVSASLWIYQNIPLGSKIYCEEWDDCLPLSYSSFNNSNQYKITSFPIYRQPDNNLKWAELQNQILQMDYIILSSNRVYGSTMTTPENYPLTSRFYTQLFDGSLGFAKVAEFSSRPNLPVPFLNLCVTPPDTRYGKVAFSSQECPLPGISFVDDYADETFTVYDHPKVLIFKNNQPKSIINNLLP